MTIQKANYNFGSIVTSVDAIIDIEFKVTF